MASSGLIFRGTQSGVAVGKVWVQQAVDPFLLLTMIDAEERMLNIETCRGLPDQTMQKFGSVVLTVMKPKELKISLGDICTTKGL
jgi:hypothetical protein